MSQHTLPETTPAFRIQNQISALAEALEEYGRNRSYLTFEEDGYVLALQGEAAKEMDDFMTAVGQYLVMVQREHGDEKAAKAELLRAFDEWLSKQKI